MRPDFETIKAIVTSTITIGIITGIVYLAGIFYDGAFLETLNIETSLFPKNFEDHILTGGLTLVSNYMRTTIYIAIALVAPYLILSIAWDNRDTRPIKYFFKKPAAQQGTAQDHYETLQDLKNKARHTFFFGLLFAVFILIAASIIVSSYNSGASYAKELIKNQYASSEESRSKITLTDGQIISAHIIRCSEHRCAMLKTKSVLIVPISEISKIEPPVTKL